MPPKQLLSRRYSEKAIRVMVLLQELILLAGLMLLLGYIHWHLAPTEMSHPGPAHAYARVMFIACLCYAYCNIQAGVVLHQRFVRADHVLHRVLLNQFYFICLTLIIFWALHVGVFFPGYLIPLYLGMTLLACLHRWQVRLCLKYVHRHGHHLLRTAFVGDLQIAQPLWKSMTDHTSGYHLIGYFNDEPLADMPATINYLGTVADVVPYLQAHPHRINELYSVLPSNRDDEADTIARHCENHLIQFCTIPQPHTYMHHRSSAEVMDGIIVLSMRPAPLSSIANRLLKRMLDIIVSLLVLLTLFPVLYVICALVIKFSSSGPVFSRQRRTGFNGKAFWLLTFRTTHFGDQSDSLQAVSTDPLTFRFGRFLRRTRLDKMPQFINVLFGEMSIVGPRPHLLSQTLFYAQALEQLSVRSFILPGITGWAQVNGSRGEAATQSQMEQKLEKDVWYIEHWSLSLDLYVILRTIALMFQWDKKSLETQSLDPTSIETQNSETYCSEDNNSVYGNSVDIQSVDNNSETYNS